MNAPVTSFDAVSITDMPPVARFNLRIAPADLAVASKAFGLSLPTKIGQGAQKAGAHEMLRTIVQAWWP